MAMPDAQKDEYLFDFAPISLWEDDYSAVKARLGRSRRFPISIVIADLNGLKVANDTRGHAEGDKLIRRMAEVLTASVRGDDVVARLGGDEFAVLLPATDAAARRQSIERVRSLVELNNKYYRTPVLRVALGGVTADGRAALADTMRQADDEVYAEKRRQHAGRV